LDELLQFEKTATENATGVEDRVKIVDFLIYLENLEKILIKDI